MNNFSLELAQSPDHLLFECVTGSRAYGTDTPESDVDLRGVFVMPRRKFFGFTLINQVSDEGNDQTYYEVGRFVELLLKNNPNILEVLYSETSCTRFRHQLFDLIKPEFVLSKLCESTFASYAMTQVRKARGLKKKIVNPMDGPRKSVLDFCMIASGQGSIPVSDWLSERGIRQESCGLAKVPHMRDIYALFEGEPSFRGIVRSPDATEVVVSSVPKGLEPLTWINFNKDGYKKYCKEYREYQDWLDNRNEARYATNIAHGRNYDSKNLMHTFRLLGMAEEIATEHRITVRRPERNFLLRIRNGEFPYEDLMAMAEEKIEAIKTAFAKSDLPEEPNRDELERVLVEIRERWYL